MAMTQEERAAAIRKAIEQSEARLNRVLERSDQQIADRKARERYRRIAGVIWALIHVAIFLGFWWAIETNKL